MFSFNELPERGTYTLILFASDKAKVNIGKLGAKAFLQGYYTYTGSALGNGASNLQYRVSRHLKREKKKRWHIDFLLTNENFTVEGVIAISVKQNSECQINQLISNQMQAKILVPKFGASDCLTKCESHLLYIGNRDAKSKIYRLFQRKFGRRVFLDMASHCLSKA